MTLHNTRWVAEWNALDISLGIKNATASGPRQKATIIFENGWFIGWSGNPCKRGYISGRFSSLPAAKRYLRRECAMPPYTRFRQEDDTCET